MGKLYSLDLDSVKILNKRKEINNEDRLNKYVDRFSKLIRQYLTDPSVYNELLLVFKAIKNCGYYIMSSDQVCFVIKLDNGWYRVTKDDPTFGWDDPDFEYHIRKAMVLNYIRFPDMLELNDLINVYRKKCKNGKNGKTNHRPFNDMKAENY